jgi:hypothetical protein
MTAATAGTPQGPTAAGSDSDAHGERVPIAVTTEGRTVVLAVLRNLDEAAGRELVKAASAAVEADSERIDVDLCALQGYTPDGARALVACRDIAARLPQGLHYRTGRGAGRDALMAAYDDSSAGDRRP